MGDDTYTWTRAELRARMRCTDEQVDGYIVEWENAARQVGMRSPVTIVGEKGDDQLFKVDPAFARLFNKMRKEGEL